MYEDSELKLIYVLKIGYNSKGEGVYEFIFSSDESNIDYDKWGWDLEPAADNADPPEGDYIDDIYHLKTGSFDLKCLHEDVERPLMHAYYNIIALAYEIPFEGETEDSAFNQYEEMFEDKDDDMPLVFHYGTTLKEVKELLYDRKIILRNKQFVESSSAELD
jgi:hypothetical protein